MNIEIFKFNEIIFSKDFYDNINIHHVKFEGEAIYLPTTTNQKDKRASVQCMNNEPYRMSLKLDLTSCPEYLMVYIYNVKLSFIENSKRRFFMRYLLGNKSNYY